MPGLLPPPVPLPASTRFRARLARTPDDLRRAQRLRHLAFVEVAGLPPRPAGLDRDRFDALCHHLLVEHCASGTLVACLRLRLYAGATSEGRAELAAGYAARHYDLTRLIRQNWQSAELGRLCQHPEWHEPDILRLLWAALTRLVESAGIEFLFGCASFAGNVPARHSAALVLLRRQYLAPLHWRPAPRAPEIVHFTALPAQSPDPDDGGALALLQRPRSDLARLPTLLRSYLALGGRVSDHAVRDPVLDTLHVFVGLEVANVPVPRARGLHRLAGGDV